jgi:glucokinase
MSVSPFALGVDIGGTNMSAAVVQIITGDVIHKETVETLPSQGADDGMARLCALIERVIAASGIAQSALLGIGIGCTGPLDIERGLVQNPFTLPSWDDLPIVQRLSDQFQLPALLVNDAQAAALGEHHAGAGRGTANMIYITVSTGIGGGFILDGRLYRGAGALAGEVGHQSLDLNGVPCYCGRRGCWEMLAAGPAIARLAQARVQPSDLLWELASGQPEQITARLVGQAAEQGDALALSVLDEVGRYLGAGIANLNNILAPQMVVLGGGVMGSFDLLLPTIEATLREQQYAASSESLRVVKAALGLNAGVVGAACGLSRHLAGQL